MKKALLFVICNLIFWTSCDKIILGVEGKEADLQGKWQIDNADTVYFNFQKHLFQYQIYQKKDAMSQAFGYYILHGDTLIDLQLPDSLTSMHLDYLHWDTIYSPEGDGLISKTYRINTLTSKKLILSSDSETLSFHKF
jgi:hypothetical protein